MLLHEHFGAWCRHLGIREALLLQPDGHRPRIVASCGVKRTAVQAAPSLAAASNKIRPATAPFRSKYIIVLDIGKRASAPAPSFRLVVGLRKRSGVDLARARELAAQVRLLAENLALRSKVDRLSASATLGELVLHSVHDLNNSLATVVACVEMLETQAAHAGSEAVGGGQEPARTWRRPSNRHGPPETLARLKGEAGHALDIARNVLSLAQGEGATEVVDCNALVERALLLRELALTRAGIQTVTELSDSPLIVRGRPVRLLQAVLNILVNAEQALADSGQPRRLMLRTRRSTAGSSARALASIEIANNGPRIATPLLPHLFQPFFTTKPRGQGTGLGLTMAREAVSRTGGRIVVENIAPGELFAEGGVRFRIDVPLSKRLPRRPSDAGLQRTGPQTMDADARPSRPLRRALVIEDDRSLGALLKAMLRDMGWQARLRGNAEDAIAEIDRVPYDAIISDLKLPGPSGEWLMEQIRARRPELVDRVLFITGDTISPAARAFLRSAGRPVLPKPFHLRELAEAMESLVEPRRKRESDAIQFRNA